jgi:hypothetical protein
MLAMGISSPDIIDAMSFAFLEDAHYIEMSADASSLGMARRQQAVSALADLLADDLVDADTGQILEV